jgi:hypothetical protein
MVAVPCGGLRNKANMFAVFGKDHSFGNACGSRNADFIELHGSKFRKQPNFWNQLRHFHEY